MCAVSLLIKTMQNSHLFDHACTENNMRVKNNAYMQRERARVCGKLVFLTR